MALAKTTFFCQNCGAESPKWLGKCPQCGEWNTYVEEVVDKQAKGKKAIIDVGAAKEEATARPIGEIGGLQMQRIAMGDKELNRTLGGGIVPGSLVLLGGEPGIGKSTLLLQVAMEPGRKVLYVSGEESSAQIRTRAERISHRNEECYLMSTTSTADIFKEVRRIQPDLLIVDSIQTVSSPYIDSAPGSISQIRECTAEFMRYSKQSATPVFLVGHITKDGGLAGPKVMEHMVDVVLQFEGHRHHLFRMLRTQKNRFGSTNELGIYEMTGEGLRPVDNPSLILLGNRSEDLSGVCVAGITEGVRPVLVEVQALVSTAAYGNPQRSTTGFDQRRLNMLLAVLEKRCGFKLAAKDVFLNLAGGIRVDDPGIDLAVATSVLSSNLDIPVSPKNCFIGEVGLSGEIRPVHRIEQRLAEAQKMGMERVFLSNHHTDLKQKNFDIELMKVGRMGEVLRGLFG